MYCYKKSLKDAVKYKTLWNKSLKLQIELNDFMVGNLMFQCEDEKTKKELYNVIDSLKKFRHNLKLKDNMVE